MLADTIVRPPIIPRQSPSTPIFTPPTQPVCGFSGNEDIYGTGIRIGIYTQILAVWFANYFSKVEAQNLRDGVTIFSLAFCVVAVIFAADKNNVYAVDVFIILQILAYSCIMGVRAKSSYNAKNFKSTVGRKVLNETINLTMVCLQFWYWWTGLDQMKETPCGTWLMYVVKTDMFGWARIVMKIFSVIFLACTVWEVAVEFPKLWSFVQLEKAKREFRDALQSWEASRHQHLTATHTPCEQQRTEGHTQEEMHDCCSRYSCSVCSPIESVFRIGTDSTLASPQSIRSSVYSTMTVPVSPKSNSIDDSTHHLSPPQTTILQQVRASELYIQNCLTASPYYQSAASNPITLLSFIRTLLRRTNRSPADIQDTPNLSQPTWFRCHLRLWGSLPTLSYPPHTIAFYTFLRQSRLLDPLNSPFQLHASFSYKPPTSTTLTYSSVSLAAAFFPSSPKRPSLGYYYAFADFLVHVLVILQIELTLVWNEVQGLGNAWDSVGQLIPAIIGVGGLGLVVGRWAVELRGKRRRRMDVEKHSGENDQDMRMDIEKSISDANLVDDWNRWKESYAAEGQ